MSEFADLLADLTDDQKAAATHGEGPLLILAGAGSGKTRVITRRVAYLLRSGVRASNILAITFTNKAAGEMKTRVEKLAPGNKVWVSTFHSLGARLLRQYADRLGYDRNFTIYDMDDRNKLVKDALEASGIDNVKFSPERIGGAISKAKNQLITPPAYAKTATDFFQQTVSTVYPLYEKRLRKANAMDFDDLLYLPAMALKLNEELRSELDARFRYVLIDEYQDTNSAQYQIVKQLSRDYPNICVVGDPDQCLLPGTLVDTPNGPKPIELIRDGDEVMSAVGGGALVARVTDKVMVNPYRGTVLRITLANGSEVRATPNHRFFGRLTPQQKFHHDQFDAEDGYEWAQRKWRLTADYTVLPEAAVLTPDADTVRYRNGLATVERARDDGFPFLRRNARFGCVRADELLVGMLVPVREGAEVIEETITAIEWEDYDGPVYDLSVPETRNFVANGVVVHNSIYKWRGSDIKIILDFERDFPNSRTITLAQNYRSTKSIIHAASVLIDHNKQRKKKDLVTDNPQGDPVNVITFDNGLDEAEGVVVRIKEAVKAGKFKYRDHAIFMRINALTRSLESAFVKHGVPFQIVKGLAFFERKENRDVLAYLRLLANPQDSVSFLRVVNEPVRGIGKVSLDKLQSFAADQEIGLLVAAGQVARITEIKGKAATGLRDFHKMMSELRSRLDLPPHELVRLVLEKSGYAAMLRDSTDEEDADRLVNVEELVTAAKQFWDEDNSRTITDFLEQITLASDVDGWDEQADHVSVMTLHASKGLEFPVVYVLAVEQGLLPHERSLSNDEEVEEERRLCFVGMTRAMKELYLCHARMREFRGQLNYCIVSQFIQELPRDVNFIDPSMSRGVARTAADEWRVKSSHASKDWADTGARPFIPPVRKPNPELKPTIPDAPDTGLAVGVLVQHEEFGLGSVTDVSGYGALRRVKVRFPAHGEKIFAGDKIRLKVVGRRKA